MTQKQLTYASLFVAIVALLVAVLALFEAGDAAGVQQMALTGSGYTDLTTLNLSNDLHVDGTSNLDDVDVDLSAPLNIDGGLVDIGGGSCSVADGDDDLCVAAVLEVDGELEADGAIDADAGIAVDGGTLDVNDAVDVDGSSDEVQLAVTGYTTQTNDLVQFDGGLVDIGGGSCSVADGDNDLCVAAVLEVDGELEADGAIDADAGIAVDGGTLDVNDAVDVDGSSDEVQLAVTGYTTQTNDLVQFDGGLVDIGGGSCSVADGDNDLCVAAVLEVDGELEADGAIDADAGIAVDGGTLDVNDAVDVDGSSDEVQLAVTGYTTQTSDLVQFDGGLVDIGGGSCSVADGDNDLCVAAVLEVGGAVYFDGAVDMDSTLDVSGTFVYGADDLTPLAFDGSTQYEVYFGNASSVTQTTVTSATHSMTTAVDWAICYVSDPDDDGGDPFLCVPTISGSSVTFQAIQDDGDNATTAATKIYYLIIGR